MCCVLYLLRVNRYPATLPFGKIAHVEDRSRHSALARVFPVVWYKSVPPPGLMVTNNNMELVTQVTIFFNLLKWGFGKNIIVKGTEERATRLMAYMMIVCFFLYFFADLDTRFFFLQPFFQVFDIRRKYAIFCD